MIYEKVICKFLGASLIAIPFVFTFVMGVSLVGLLAMFEVVAIVAFALSLVYVGFSLYFR